MENGDWRKFQMPTLENDRLVFRFPKIEENASVSISFQRTLRIPDTDAEYPLPPGLGNFSLRHTEDYAERLGDATVERGGVIMPIWQAEAMWIQFSNHGPEPGLDFPVAIKVATGKINAVSGEPWRPGLHRDPQDYMVSPSQRWLDGYAVEARTNPAKSFLDNTTTAAGVIRQFIAMPLGEGYSAEEQITGEARWGGLQIAVMPLKRAVWERSKVRWESWKREQQVRKPEIRPYAPSSSKVFMKLPSLGTMGLAPGGLMRQAIYPDRYNIDDWDIDASDRVFVTLVHAKEWKAITAEAPATYPPSADEYSKAGLPWFDFYGVDQEALPGIEKLTKLHSVGKKFKEKTGAELPDSTDVETGAPFALSQEKPFRPVRSHDI